MARVLALLGLLTACAEAYDADDDAGPGEPSTRDGLPDAAMADPESPDAILDPADASPAPPPDAVPTCTAPMPVPLLANAAFDLGPVTWTTNSNQIIVMPPPAVLTPHSPAYAARLAGINGVTHRLAQAVDVPATTTGLRLRGFRCFASSQTAGATDVLRILLVDPATGTPLETIQTFTNLNAVPICNFVAFELPSAGAHAGARIELVFEGVNDAAVETAFWLDSLVLEALVCDPGPG